MKRAIFRKYHYIYKITRNQDGKFYVGMHSTDDLDDGYFGSGLGHGKMVENIPISNS